MENFWKKFKNFMKNFEKILNNFWNFFWKFLKNFFENFFWNFFLKNSAQAACKEPSKIKIAKVWKSESGESLGSCLEMLMKKTQKKVTPRPDPSEGGSGKKCIIK